MSPEKIKLKKSDQTYLEKLARSAKASSRHKKRAKVILAISKGKSDDQIMKSTGVVYGSIRKWHERFLEDGVDFIESGNKAGGGRKKSLKDAQIEKILDYGKKAIGGDYSITCQSVAEKYGTSKSTVNRIWTSNGLRLPNHGRWKKEVYKKKYPKVRPSIRAKKK